jgi:PAS domain S-box-containing protein
MGPSPKTVPPPTFSDNTHPFTDGNCNMVDNKHAEISRDEKALKKQLLQLQRTNQDLLRRLEQMSCLLNNLPGMAFRCLYDNQLTFEYASNGSKEILGYDPDQITSGRAFRQMVHADDQENNKQIINSLTPENNRYQMTYRMQAAWGENRWIYEQGTAIFSDSGELIAIEGLLTDITEQKTREIKLYEENDRLRSSIKERYRLGELIGKSPAMQLVYERIVKAAASDATVIINGESGTGKELAARAIHELSERKKHPFVVVNCGAISESLLESEFFGHVRGSFSGAYVDREGFLMAADCGTLFLDEIGEMPLPLQVKLLRALDGRGFTPVGDTRTLHSDFRLISATNRDLEEMVRNGSMREDFYYRINTVPILMPPLRDRKDDLPLLIEYLASALAGGKSPDIQFPPEFFQTLSQHSWPGNIRELQNVIRRYLTIKEISFRPLAAASAQPEKPTAALPVAGPLVGQPVLGAIADVERGVLLAALQQNRWHMGRTATALGVSRRTLQRRVHKYQLKQS